MQNDNGCSHEFTLANVIVRVDIFLQQLEFIGFECQPNQVSIDHPHV